MKLSKNLVRIPLIIFLACFTPVFLEAQKIKKAPDYPVLIQIDPDTIPVNVLGKDTSACLKGFPTKYFYKHVESINWLDSYKITYESSRGGYEITHFFSADSVLVCQEAKISSHLISLIPVQGTGKIIPDVFLNCGNGKIRDYNANYLLGSWNDNVSEKKWGVADLWYANGQKIKTVELDLQGKDTLRVYEKDTLNNYSSSIEHARYFFEGKEIIRARFDRTELIEFHFVNEACSTKEIIFDTIEQVYKKDGVICNGKFDLFYTEQEDIGQISRRIFFTNGKIDSTIFYNSYSGGAEIKPCTRTNYHNNTEINFYYEGEGILTDVTNFSFPPVAQKDILHNAITKRYEDGKSTSYYSDGTLSQVSYYKKGTPVGTWLYYNFSGNLYKKETYNRKGKLVKYEIVGAAPQYTL